MYLSQHAAAAAHQQSPDQALECLIFLLGEEAYGIDFLAVREIRGYDGVLPVAGTSNCLKGVVNLRGTLVPVVDLRIRFSLGEARYDHVTDILVVETGRGIGGIVVDNVSEVARVEAGQIGPVTDAGHPGALGYLGGVTQRDGRKLGFIDIARIFADIPMNPQACQLA
jgi:purine-binding chemotaxis protein CheW